MNDTKKDMRNEATKEKKKNYLGIKKGQNRPGRQSAPYTPAWVCEAV